MCTYIICQYNIQDRKQIQIIIFGFQRNISINYESNVVFNRAKNSKSMIKYISTTDKWVFKDFYFRSLSLFLFCCCDCIVLYILLLLLITVNFPVKVSGFIKLVPDMNLCLLATQGRFCHLLQNGYRNLNHYTRKCMFRSATGNFSSSACAMPACILSSDLQALLSTFLQSVDILLCFPSFDYVFGIMLSKTSHYLVS